MPLFYSSSMYSRSAHEPAKYIFGYLFHRCLLFDDTEQDCPHWHYLTVHNAVIYKPVCWGLACLQRQLCSGGRSSIFLRRIR